MKLEFHETSSLHRLVDETTGEVTQWAVYCNFTYLNGYVGYTGFFADVAGVCTADQFCRMVGIGK